MGQMSSDLKPLNCSFLPFSLVTGIAANLLLCECSSFKIQDMVFCRQSSSQIFLIKMPSETGLCASQFLLLFSDDLFTSVTVPVSNLEGIHTELILK